MTPPAAVRARVAPSLSIHQDGASVRIDVRNYGTARARSSSSDGHSNSVRLAARLASKIYMQFLSGTWSGAPAVMHALRCEANS